MLRRYRCKLEMWLSGCVVVCDSGIVVCWSLCMVGIVVHWSVCMVTHWFVGMVDTDIDVWLIW